jgi:hypothetical protein
MQKKKPNSKDPAAVALAAKSVAVRMKWPKKKRVEQGRRAVASRRDRQPKGPWYGLLVYPKDYRWRGRAHLSRLLDKMHADPSHQRPDIPKVEFWSPNRADVVAKANTPKYRYRATDVIEQAWNPDSFSIRRESKVDPDAQLKALRAVLKSDGGGVL